MLSLLQRLAADHLVKQGLIVIGDVAFATAAARRQSGAEGWDEDEHYWAADEAMTACARAGLAVTSKPISWCIGAFVMWQTNRTEEQP